MLYVGLDWGETTHALCVLDTEGRLLERDQVPESVAGVKRVHALLARHTAEPTDVIIGIETDRGLLVHALIAAGYQVYAINPLAASRYRERHATSGAKSDPGDAKMLAELVRTDRQNHRAVAGDSTLAEGIKVTARAHQNLIWSRQRHTNQLRSALREYYPNALVAFGKDLDAPEAMTVLQKAPTPAMGRRLSHRQILSALRKAGRERYLDTRATAIQQALRADQLELPAPLADAYGASVAATVRIIAELNRQIASLEAQLDAQLNDHPDAEIIESLPGLGTVLSARVLGEFGGGTLWVPSRYADSSARKCYAGTAPITKASGKKRVVLARYARNKRLGDATYWWAMGACNGSAGAKQLYDRQRSNGKTHHQALRVVANRMVGILHGCLRHRKVYDEAVAWPNLTVVTSGSGPADGHASTKEPAMHQNKSLKMTGDHHGSDSSLTASA